MPDRPNILQITTHDSGRHFGCYGHPTLQTPAIDRLAADGVQFTNCFCTVPICSASRASQLTGLYPQSNGLLDLTGFGWRMKDDVRHAGQIFKAAGYRTLLFGIQHEDNDPARLGIEIAKPSPAHAAGVAETVSAFLQNEARAAQPFYAQVGFFETHTPFDFVGTAPDTENGVEIPPYLANTDSSRQSMAGYQGAVRTADTAVGAILDALRRSGLEDNTLVVVTTDHGIEMPRAKWHLYDPGIEIALIMRFPRAGLRGGRKCDLLMSNVDYLPTVLSLTGVETASPMDGRSFAGASAPVRDAVFGLYHKTATRCVRTDRYKLIRHFDNSTDYCTLPVRSEDVMQRRVIPQVELFDLKADPNEFENLADRPDHQEVQRRLDTQLWNWMESVHDPLLAGPVSTPSYLAAIADYKAWRSQH